jgi:hypothetical protein
MELEEGKLDAASRLLEIENDSIDPETKALIMLYEAENQAVLSQKHAKATVKIEEKSNDFICLICREDFYEDNTIPLIGCEHIFHKECLQYYLKS